MEGIQFVINDDGEKTAVLIDLTKYMSYGKASMTLLRRV